MTKLHEMGATALAEKLAAGEVSSLEVTQSLLAHIEQTDSDLGAFLRVTGTPALEQARQSDRRRAAGQPLSKLDGVPMALKDNICTKGVETSCASRMLAGFVPPYSATVCEKLSAAGAVLLGKLNMDEFAMGSSNENSAVKPVRNPKDQSRVPGGSSGGPAAAVAAGQVPFALGSDTGGSIRQPAAFCGVVGVKPTYGTVSRYGLIAFASSLDQIGPLARNVPDAALVLAAISGQDPKDTTSRKEGVPSYRLPREADVKGLRIALPREFFGEGISEDVCGAVLAAAKRFEAMGALVEEISLPALLHALPAYYVISSAEASSNLARFDGVRYGSRAQGFSSAEDMYKKTRSEGFGPEVQRRILLGTFALSAGYYDAYYKKALQVRTLVTRAFEEAFESYDLLLTPTAPTVAYRFGEKSDPMEMYRGDVCTVPANIAGIPALSMPCGSGEWGLPVGMQLMAKSLNEPLLLRTALAFEQEGGAPS